MAPGLPQKQPGCHIKREHAMPTEKPIIFSAPMVKAILDGRKTQTRRVVRFGTEWGGPGDLDGLSDYGLSLMRHCCPHGKIGDHLWVRENFSIGGWATDDNKVVVVYSAHGDESAMWRQADAEYIQKSASSMEKWILSQKHHHDPHRIRPSIHMPRWASRITLKITGIRVERLQDISTSDAIAEGIDAVMEQKTIYLACGKGHLTPVSAFHTLWDSINSKKHPWSSNPWVWVISFDWKMKNA